MTAIHLVVALERFEGLNVLQFGWLPHPLYGLPGRHHPDILHGDDGVQEQLESLLVVRGGEPDKGKSGNKLFWAAVPQLYNTTPS